MKVAYLGPLRTYTHLAALEYFGEGPEYVPMNTARVCRAVRQGEVDYGVLAIENSSAGFVEATLDALYATAQVQIHDEIYMPIRHQFLSKASSLKDVKRVYSHAQAFWQCSKTLSRLEKQAGHPFSRMVVESTSRGAQLAQNEPDSAAIASEQAAEAYDLPILVRDIQDRRNNTTRFWVLSLGRLPQPSGHDRTAFLVELEHKSGTLRSLLDLFADRGINMLWVQTRPIVSEERGGRWEYAFFLEFEGHVKNESLATVYSVLGSGKAPMLRRGRKARLLGSYPNRLGRIDGT